MSIEQKEKEALTVQPTSVPATGVPPIDFWSIPQVRESIPKIVGIAEWYFKDRSKSNLTITYIFVALLGGLTVGAFALTLMKLISGETLIFLIGSLFGYVFAFLQRYLGPST